MPSSLKSATLSIPHAGSRGRWHPWFLHSFRSSAIPATPRLWFSPQDVRVPVAVEISHTLDAPRRITSDTGTLGSCTRSVHQPYLQRPARGFLHRISAFPSPSKSATLSTPHSGSRAVRHPWSLRSPRSSATPAPARSSYSATGCPPSHRVEIASALRYPHADQRAGAWRPLVSCTGSVHQPDLQRPACRIPPQDVRFTIPIEIRHTLDTPRRITRGSGMPLVTLPTVSRSVHQPHLHGPACRIPPQDVRFTIVVEIIYSFLRTGELTAPMSTVAVPSSSPSTTLCSIEIRKPLGSMNRFVVSCIDTWRSRV